MTTDGVSSLFWSAPAGPIGNVIYRDTFYVVWGTSPGKISGLDLATGTEVMRVTLTGSRWPDGVTGDTSGNLWIADCGESSLYKLNLASRAVTKLAVPEMAVSIQDVCFDATANRLILVSYSASSFIQSYEIATGQLTTIAVVPYAYLDGIARDHAGNYFVSGHLSGKIYMFDSAITSPALTVLSDLSNPSNISYNLRDHLLIVTLFGADSLALIPFESYQDEDHDTIPASRDNCPNNYNPSQEDADKDGTGNACCCLGARANINAAGIVDLADLSSLVSYLTGGGYNLPCPNEANVNAEGIVDLADLSSLVSYLTGGGYILPNCA